MNKETLASSATALTSFGLSFLPELNIILQFIVLCVGLITGVIGLINLFSQWWKKAKADGKLTKEEIEEGVDILNQGISTLNDHLTNFDKDKRDEIKKERGDKNG